jgi:hypothetical protein
LTKVELDFAHLALYENAPNMLMCLLQLRTMHFLLQARTKRKTLMCSSMATMIIIKNFLKIALFFNKMFQRFIFFPRLLYSLSAVGECAKGKKIVVGKGT